MITANPQFTFHIIIIIIIIHSAHVECEIKSDTSNNRGNWNHLKIIQTVPQQHTEKARIKELQKTATVDTAHILRKVLT